MTAIRMTDVEGNGIWVTRIGSTTVAAAAEVRFLVIGRRTRKARGPLAPTATLR